MFERDSTTVGRVIAKGLECWSWVRWGRATAFVELKKRPLLSTGFRRHADHSTGLQA